jgi:hypothetical protein
MSNNQERAPVIPRIVDPQAPRDKDYALGVDDIGLPEDIVPDGAKKPEDIKPDPGRMTPNVKPADNRS